jgi:type I restriction enzyme S subunit
MANVKLKDLSELVMGQSPDSTSYNSIGDGLPFYQGKKDFGKLNPKVSMYCSKPKKIALKNDILISVRAPVGDINIANEKCCIGRGLASIRVNDSVIDKMYLFRFLEKYKNILSNQGNGSTFNSIKKNDLENIEIPLPTLTKQKKIAKVLDRANELITLRKESIKKLKKLSKSIFIDMFGDPVLNPKGWDIVTLDYYGTLSRGKSSHRPRNAPELYNGKYPFIQTGDLSNGNNIYLKDYKQTYSEIGIKQSKLFPINTIGIAIAANIGNTKILKREFYFPDSVVGFITECPEFCVFLIEFYRKKLEERATKTAQKNINLKILNELEVIKVPITLQKKFANIIEKIEEQKVLYEKELKLLEDNFNSLLQRSFS